MFGSISDLTPFATPAPHGQPLKSILRSQDALFTEESNLPAKVP
jgi:hypothetical protein